MDFPQQELLGSRPGRSAPARRDRSLVDVELFLMEQGIALHDDGFAGELFHLLQPARVVSLQRLYHFWIHAQQDVVTFEVPRHLTHLYINLITDRLHALDHSRSGTINARG